MASADELKAQGNKAFSAKDYDTAIELFSKALELDANNFVLWSNRSAAKAGKREWTGALQDAEQVCPFTTLLWRVTFLHARITSTPSIRFGLFP